MRLLTASSAFQHFQIFLKAYADAAALVGAKLATGQISDFIKNRHVEKSDMKNRLKVVPAESDQAAFAAVMIKEAKDRKTHENHPFANAYEYFKDELSRWLKELDVHAGSTGKSRDIIAS